MTTAAERQKERIKELERTGYSPTSKPVQFAIAAYHELEALESKATPSEVAQQLKLVIAKKWWHPHGEPGAKSVLVVDLLPILELAEKSALDATKSDTSGPKVESPEDSSI